MNILVTGGNGQLGTEMRLLAVGSQDRYIFTDVNEQEGYATTYLDITDREAVRLMVQSESIDAIVNCAAWTNVDACETDDRLANMAHALNADAVENLAIAMKEVNGLLLHISTDYVFGGEPYNTPCNEEQQGTPTGVYGRTKKEGEARILCTGCKHVILRTAWLYSEFGRNFLLTMLRLTAEKATLKVVCDQCGTPTYALDLARAVQAVLQDYAGQGVASTEAYAKSGIYHYSNQGVCSWYDFAQMIQRMANDIAPYDQPHRQCNIQPCTSKEFPSPVRRPAYSVLDKTKVQQTFGIEVPYWVDSLRECLERVTSY